MITPELIGYIRGEFARGKTREEIRTVLVADGGWSEADLSEAFRTVIPMQGFIPPKAKSFLSSSFLPMLATFVVIGGLFFAVWWFYRTPVVRLWNSLVSNVPKLSMPEFSLPKLSMPFLGTKKTNNTIKTVVRSNPVVPTKVGIPTEVGIKDCGIGTTPDLKNPLTYQNDAVLACLGNSALRCESARAVLKDALFPTIFQIVRENTGSRSTCNFRLSYEENSTLVDITLQKLAGQYILCPLSIVKMLDESNRVSSFSIPSINNPSKYASQIYFYGTLGLFIESNLDQNKIRALGCRGDYISSVVASYNKTQSQQ